MSKLRPELRDGKPDAPVLTYEQTYFRVLESVKARRSLAHGHLHDPASGHSCAIGSYFDDAKGICLPTKAIDEIAAYNDSFPSLTPSQRWRKVAAWLRFRIDTMRKAS